MMFSSLEILVNKYVTNKISELNAVTNKYKMEKKKAYVL
jgi:hypothetical protein